MGLLKKKTNYGHRVGRYYRKSLKISCSSNRILNVHTVVEKERTPNGSPNKKRKIVANVLNFKEKQEVLSVYKA